MQSSLQPKSICSRTGFALAGLFAAYFAFALLLSQLFTLWVQNTNNSELLAWVARHLVQNGLLSWLINDLALYAAALPVFLLIGRLVPPAPARPRLPGKLTFGHFLLFFVFCIGTMYGLALVASFLNTLFQTFLNLLRDTPAPTALSGIPQSTSALVNFIFFVLIPPIGEEFIFRFLLHRKLRGASDLTFILISGLVFSLFHGNLAQAIYTFPSGLVFAYAYVKTGKLWAPMGLHFLCNLFGGILLPAMAANNFTAVLSFLLILGLMICSIVLFVKNYRRILNELRPPLQPGWPWRQPRPVPSYQTVYYYPPYAPQRESQGQGAAPPAPHTPGVPQPAAYGQAPFAPLACPPPHTPQSPYAPPPATYGPAAHGQAPSTPLAYPPPHTPQSPYAPAPAAWPPPAPPGESPGQGAAPPAPHTPGVPQPAAYGPAAHGQAPFAPLAYPPPHIPQNPYAPPPGPWHPTVPYTRLVRSAEMPRPRYGMAPIRCLLNPGMMLYICLSLAMVILTVIMA